MIIFATKSEQIVIIPKGHLEQKKFKLVLSAAAILLLQP